MRVAFSPRASPPVGSTGKLVDNEGVERWEGVIELSGDNVAFVDLPELPRPGWKFVVSVERGRAEEADRDV